jgi:hypothetical protein
MWRTCYTAISFLFSGPPRVPRLAHNFFDLSVLLVLLFVSHKENQSTLDFETVTHMFSSRIVTLVVVFMHIYVCMVPQSCHGFEVASGSVKGVWSIKWVSTSTADSLIPSGTFIQKDTVVNGQVPLIYFWIHEQLTPRGTFDLVNLDIQEHFVLVPNVGVQAKKRDDANNYFIYPAVSLTDTLAAKVGGAPYGYSLELLSFEKNGDKFTTFNGNSLFMRKPLFTTKATYGGRLTSPNKHLKYLWTLRDQAWIGSVASMKVCAQMTARQRSIVSVTDFEYENKKLLGPKGKIEFDGIAWYDMAVGFENPGISCSGYSYSKSMKRRVALHVSELKKTSRKTKTVGAGLSAASKVAQAITKT